MKRVLVAAAALTTLSACGGGTEPKSVPIPTIEPSYTTTTAPLPSTTTPTSTTTTTTTTTTPPPPPPTTEVPEVAPPPPAPYTPPPPPAEPADAYYANCAEARAAGAAPLYRGEPGYRPALDRDDDGVACET